LWPQAGQGVGFRVKDKLENGLHKMICAGQLTLPEAQKCLPVDWHQYGLKLKVFDAAGQLLPREQGDVRH
jgi:hypothetical protein